MITSATVAIQGDAFCVREVGDETLFFAKTGEELHCLNELGTFIWQSIDGDRCVGEIIGRLCAEYEVSPDMAERDVHHFMKVLTEKGLITVRQGAVQ